ncbi:bifunctional diguanylate cyclase/phosphodiesterase [Persephonella sp.]|uniref:putative bifunctional diguanylate cyclase/phosphodiesterase n=1 Tax=Persephonella sp. TaxID=2060922 RepID=UPI0025CE50E7|nr:bifunctional diguanylate cyclase/phosphodiesterase [Persephonella sp.]
MKKSLDFENLRREIALKNGIIMENLLRYNSLIQGMRQELRKSEKKDLPFYDTLLKKIQTVFDENLELVKNGSLETIDLVSILEKEVIDKSLLQKETEILKKIVLSRENITDWKGYTVKLLKQMLDVYPFDLFFISINENSMKRVYLFYSFQFGDDIRSKVREYLKKELFNRENIEFEEIFVTKKKPSGNKQKICLQTYNFLPDSQDVGGIIGIIILSKSKLPKKELDVVQSLLSIMGLVAGSSRALSKALSELEYFAGHDPLTDLYNRRIFEDLLRYEVSRAKRKGYRFSLILIDLDNFKYINDTYGHNVGDVVLKSVADMLEASIRDGDLVARIGGDEFVILLSETPLLEAVKVAERIRRNLEKNRICVFDGSVISVSASLGVVEYPTHGSSKEELMMIVDNALYKAKDLGKNKVYVPTEEEIKQTIKEKRKEFYILQEALDQSLFIPYYQPIVDLKTGKIHAYEVLARLKDHSGEVISAYRFITLAEKLGKVKDIDRVIIKKALTKKASSKKNFKIFLNLSAAELSDDQFWNYIFSIVNRSGLKPEDIVFEITEREAIKGIGEFQSLISKLKNRGYRFAIDDFGSGYSSFYYLKHLPIDYVKIDGEFVKELSLKDPKSTAFVESIVFLCKRLNIKTVAEFIENESILKIVKKIGIDYGQGYFLGHPSEDYL